VIGTGISFLTFGLGGLFLRMFVIPPMQWFIRDDLKRQRRVRRVVQRSFWLFVEWMRVLGVMTYEIHGRERLHRDGLLVLANHPTLIDVVLLVSLLPNADCVVKSAVARNARAAPQAAAWRRQYRGAWTLRYHPRPHHLHAADAGQRGEVVSCAADAVSYGDRCSGRPADRPVPERNGGGGPGGRGRGAGSPASHGTSGQSFRGRATTCRHLSTRSRN